MSQSIEKIRSNCPRDCYDECGIIKLLHKAEKSDMGESTSVHSTEVYISLLV
jgi:hypothetical protein